MGLMNWWHHITEPHCLDCLNKYSCRTCETLKNLLEQERYEKTKLIQQIIDLTSPKIETVISGATPEEFKPKITSWRAKQQELEANDRIEARILADRKKTEALEKKLDIPQVKENAS